MQEIDWLKNLFHHAVTIADPLQAVPKHLPSFPSAKRVVVLGAGKASARMAEAVETHWRDNYGDKYEGLVITRYGYANPNRLTQSNGIEIVEAAHPIPDEAGLKAGERLLTLADSLTEEDYVLALISGGASALMVAPAFGLSLEQKQAVNAALLACGAPITQINQVRMALSNIKGGQLAARCYPATLHSLIISDVPGDDPAIIGSGATYPQHIDYRQAVTVLDQFNINLPHRAHMQLLKKADKQVQSEATPQPYLNDNKITHQIIMTPQQALQETAEFARTEGIEVILLGDQIEGEAKDIAAQHARLALTYQAKLESGKSLLLLSGGELTVTKTGNGTGGPNGEYMLSLAIVLAGKDNIWALAGDTDGVDGSFTKETGEIAGAFIDPNTLIRANNIGVDPHQALAQNNSHMFFQAINQNLITGPTFTNINDFRAILIRSNQ